MPTRWPCEPRADEQVQPAQDLLMPHIGRRCHVMLPVDQLVPLPIVREEQEVVVGELQTGSGTPDRVGWAFMSLFPGMRSF